MPQAVSLAEELKAKFSVESELIKGSGGIFDVVVDGSKVFAKSETGRFPKAGEVSALMEG